MWDAGREHRLHQDAEGEGRGGEGMTLASSSYMKTPPEGLNSGLSYLLARHLDCLFFLGGGPLVSAGNSPGYKEASRSLSLGGGVRGGGGWGFVDPQTSASPYALLFRQE